MNNNRYGIIPDSTPNFNRYISDNNRYMPNISRYIQIEIGIYCIVIGI